MACGGRSSRAAAARTGRAEGDEALGWDIFGFTNRSDVGSPGERSIAFEMTSGLGRRVGLYWSPIFSGELSYTITRTSQYRCRRS